MAGRGRRVPTSIDISELVQKIVMKSSVFSDICPQEVKERYCT